MEITKGDTLTNFIKVTTIEPFFEHDRLIIQIGQMNKIYDFPTYPLYISFTPEETILFDNLNYVYMKVINTITNEERTLEGTACFKALNIKVCSE